MSTISISDHLHNQWAFARNRPFLGEFGRLSDSEDVHPIDLNTRDLITAREKGGILG